MFDDGAASPSIDKQARPLLHVCVGTVETGGRKSFERGVAGPCVSLLVYLVLARSPGGLPTSQVFLARWSPFARCGSFSFCYFCNLYTGLAQPTR